MQHGLTDEQLEAGFIGSPEYIQNHGGSGAGWVTGMYQDLLGRTPSQAEVNAWVKALASGMSAVQVAHCFAASAEREGQRVQSDYQTFLGRAASPTEVAAWVSAFENGYTNEDVIAGFVGSPEYFDTRGGGTITGWVDSAIQDVFQRAATPAEEAAWGQFLN
jgi:hypothetical protein